MGVFDIFLSPKDLASLEKWRNSQTKAAGLWPSAVNAPEPEIVCAVCIPPGAQLEFTIIEERLQLEFSISATENVVFCQLSMDADCYCDAVQFENGAEVLLQCFRSGTTNVKVVSLEAATERKTVEEAYAYVAYLH